MQQSYQDIEVILEEDIYHKRLKIINGIHFTDREVDIIACILGGRATKKVATFLSISPNTVECHIRNIMLKIGCNSRENIVDFIEKSNQFFNIKKYYSILLIKIAFEQELKKIKKLTNNNINCLNIYYKTEKTKDPFIVQLEEHLKIAGINIISKIWRKDKTKSYLDDNVNSQQINCIIYSISKEFVERLTTLGYEINAEANHYKWLLKENNIPIIFLLLSNQNSTTMQVNLTNFPCINLAEQNNYYFLVFEILKKLLSNINIDKNIVAFEKQYKLLHIQSSAKQGLTTRDLSKLSQHEQPIKSKKGLLLKITATLTMLSIVSFLFYDVQELITKLILHKPARIELDYDEQLPNNNISDNISAKYNNSILDNDIDQLVKEMGNKILFNLPPRNFHFTGRTLYLNYIQEQLNKQRMGIITQVISGLGGVGKTQLATEFAYNAHENNFYKAIIWIEVETPNTIYDSYKEIAAKLKIDCRGLTTNEIQFSVHKTLAQICKNGKILFILDNVAHYEEVQTYLFNLYEQFTPNVYPKILITSRSQYWSENPLILDGFQPDEALHFIREHLPSEKDSAINKLAQELHYFPLAIGQAISYVKIHTNIDDYLELYAAKPKEYLDISLEDNEQYIESLWQTWHIALAKLDNNTREFLYISAYLNPDNIQIDLFTNFTLEQKMKIIKTLRKHSFIKLNSDGKSFEIHRLLQKVIKLTLKDKNQYSSRAMDLVKK